jgi:hypothetical protein
MMMNEPGDFNFTKRAKQILLGGGTHEMTIESGESFFDWLPFLTNPLNLQPGLPDLTLVLDSRRMDESVLNVTFDKNKASLRSMKLELRDFHEGYTDIFLDNDNDTKEFTKLIESTTMSPRCFRKWIFNLFLHTELEELQVPFANTELPDLFAILAIRKKLA